MARTEDQLRAWYGTHPDDCQRCTDDECVQCEMRDLLAEIDRLRQIPVDITTKLRDVIDPQPWGQLDLGYNDGISRALEIVCEALS